MAIRSRNKVSLEFSMSSMTDIVFLLLIFFIVLSTLVSPYGENIKLPAKGPSSNSTNNSLIVSLRTNGDFLLNQRQISENGLVQELERRKDNPNKPPLVLNVESSVPAGTTMKIFSLAKQNEFEVVLKAQPRKR